ncbi:MAG: hypothetical protein GKR94_00010 [Gammaproteobacteria bacterium]|nr:hypothetical protein [Gammaproteobacteria bacterium]
MLRSGEAIRDALNNAGCLAAQTQWGEAKVDRHVYQSTKGHLMTAKHSEHSSYREKLIEHLFVGELLKLSWQNGDCSLEVASPEVDNSGYDIIAELLLRQKITRHKLIKCVIVML